jgi:hypothetical protein
MIVGFEPQEWKRLDLDWQALKPHPLADLFPMMDDQEFERLLADIRANGYDRGRPIILFEGMILDGRNRHKALLVLDAADECYAQRPFMQYEQRPDEASPLDWVISVNLNRRHLSEGQRAMVAAKIANLKPGRPSETAQVCAVSQSDAAERLNVSRRAVQMAKSVQEASPELAQEVSEGRMSLNRAVKESRPANPTPSARPSVDPPSPLSPEEWQELRYDLGQIHSLLWNYARNRAEWEVRIERADRSGHYIPDGKPETKAEDKVYEGAWRACWVQDAEPIFMRTFEAVERVARHCGFPWPDRHLGGSAPGAPPEG